MEHLTSTQLAEWEAYNILEPIGEYRQDYMMASIIKTIVDVAQSAFGKRGKRLTTTPWDFVPWRPADVTSDKMQTIEEQKAILKAVASAAATSSEQGGAHGKHRRANRRPRS